MSVFRKAMVYLGLVDDDEYYGDDGELLRGRGRRRSAAERHDRPTEPRRGARPRRVRPALSP